MIKDFDLTHISISKKENDKNTFIDMIYEILEGYSNSLKELFKQYNSKLVPIMTLKNGLAIIGKGFRLTLFEIDINEKENIYIFSSNIPNDFDEYPKEKFETIDQLYQIIYLHLHNINIKKNIYFLINNNE